MMRFLFILFLSAAINSVEARRVAIVFGNSKYAPEMQSAAIDAEYIIKKLKLAEFDIINDKVYNLTRSDLASEIQKASNIISEGDDMIVYYSGHGIQCNGKNYIIPIDYDLSNTECETNKLYSIENFLDLLGSKNARLKLLILDACRNSTTSSKNGLAESKVLSDAMIWYSSDFNSFSLPADSGNSLFTKHLLVQLDRGQTDPSTITDIFDRAKNMVEKESNNRQSPQRAGRSMNFLYTPLSVIQTRKTDYKINGVLQNFKLKISATSDLSRTPKNNNINIVGQDGSQEIYVPYGSKIEINASAQDSTISYPKDGGVYVKITSISQSAKIEVY